MVSKNYKSDLDDVFKKFKKFADANQYYRQEKDRIEGATRTSINQTVSASSASDEKRQELLSDARENADKAASILLRVHHRLVNDYGRFWRQDIITHQFFAIPEQEIVEAFSVLAALNEAPIPTSTIHFRIRDPGEFERSEATLTVSGEAYVFGLLDCVGELARMIQDSPKNNKTEFLKQIFKQMEELYAKLERFKEFPNRTDLKYLETHKTKNFAHLKSRIDTCAGQVRRCKQLLHDSGIL
jgi:predicted translin family RNA/ssDNA-binding protein